MNRLSSEKSAYLRHAAGQPVDWYPWGDEAFERAAAEDKPVFLSSGAVWCHWCHVMARESFEDPEVARVLRENFISVKLDRDERPDIDRRYQQAAAASGVGGGWPLSAFLTHDRQPFFMGTYFPPEDAYGRPGFKRLLRTVAHVYRTKRDEIEEHAGELLDATKSGGAVAGSIEEQVLEEGAGLALSQFDSQNGGFGKAPKFPMAGAIEFLMQRYAMTGNGVIASAVRKTLDAMMDGGFHDQLGGGFHRYSVDESWGVPHFEKMADDNAWLLKVYVDAYSLFEDVRYKRVAQGIVGFVREVLSDESGGFYASQDADVTPDDEGGYFTWTGQDLKNLLEPEEERVFSLAYLSPKGVPDHASSKTVLLRAMTVEEVSRRLHMEISEVARAIERSKTKLLAQRRARTAPFVDTTLYTSLNGMLIAAFLHASRVLADRDSEAFALKSLSRMLEERFVGEVLFHSDGVEGFLDDHVNLAQALLEAYETTGDVSHLARATAMMDRTIDRFRDARNGGFFDTSQEVLGARLATTEDMPHPAPNSVAIMLLVKLSALTGEERYRVLAEEALKGGIVAARRAGAHAGSFFAALDAFYHLVSLRLEGALSQDLSAGALGLVMPFTAVSHGPVATGEPARIIPCRNNVCLEPLLDPSSFRAFVETIPGFHK
jgi:uncharacterized protein YyaL (SSP411 family)